MNQGKRIRIMKELLKEIVQRRKYYRKLVEKLNSEHVRYRWLIPECLSFMWDNKLLIKTIDQMKEFLNQKAKKQEDSN